ncbi:MAG: glutathione S-transferase N-terminal domain-containing protein [Pseudomonadota bacterium]
MTMRLFDLALADDELRPSPWCWLAKFSLLHKGVEFETVPLRFAEKENYPDPEHGKLPVLETGDGLIVDSAHIIAWLEKNIAGNPLAGSDCEWAAADFYQAWLGAQIYPPLAKMCLGRVWALAHADDQDYFRTAREKFLGKTLEEAMAEPGNDKALERALGVLAAPLARRKFLGGETPNICDYRVMAPFMWQRTLTGDELYETPQAVAAWQERMLDLFDGYGRQAKTAS